MQRRGPLAVPVLPTVCRRSSVPTGRPWIIGNSTCCCRGGLSKYQLALDHFQTTAWVTKPRRITRIVIVLDQLAMGSAAVHGSSLDRWLNELKHLAASAS